MRYLVVLTRSLGFFSLPFLKKIRTFAYRSFFKAKNLSVSDRVYIVKPHKNDSAVITFKENVELGKDVYIDYSGSVKIGKNVSISEGVKIYTHNHNIDGEVDWRRNGIKFSEIIVEDYTWIGAGSTILPNVKRIGKGAIIAASSVVTKDVNDFQIVAGNPAKVIGIRNLNEN